MEANKKNIIVLTGAGISAESGIPTFRGVDGLWEGYKLEEVATPDAWHKDPGLVLKFYNERRRAARNAKPNKAHVALAELENDFNVSIITQNIDNLHEQAGSSNIIHLHGELFKSRSTTNNNVVYAMDTEDINLGDTCELGSQLRPHVVWFGEAVPKMDDAIAIVMTADALMVVGTSLQVYPAAGLIHYAPDNCKLLLVDPQVPKLTIGKFEYILEPASIGVPKAILAIKRLLT